MPDPNVDELLKRVSRLQPLPGNAARLLKALDDPFVSAWLVAELIALDQALTAYILRVANSAGMGYRTACSSVKEAVMRLGFKVVRSLVLNTVVTGPLTARLGGYRLGDKELWYHSLAVACGAHWLVGVVRYPDPEEAYVAGLLHDIGKLLLDQWVKAGYQKIVERVQVHHLPLWQVEEQLFGIDHAAVGGMIASHWQFPPALVEAIQYHHNPVQSQAQSRLAAIVNLANALVTRDSQGLDALEGRAIHPETLRIFNLSAEAAERLRLKMAEALFAYQARQLV